MVDFYAHYISTSSPYRSKLSVHLQAQAKPKVPTLDELKASTMAALKVLFTEHEINSDDAKLQDHINATSSAEAIPEFVSTYLNSVLQLEQSMANKILDESKAALGMADSGLPAEPEVLADESMVDASQPVLIKDIHTWKAGMQISAGVKPVRNLDDFVEVAEKL
jgi:insulysin